MCLLLCEGNPVILIHCMVNTVTSQLHRHNGILPPAHGIRLVMLVCVWIIVRFESDAASPERWVVFHHPTGNVEHPLRLFKSFAYHPCHIIDSNLHLSQLVANTEIYGIHLAVYQLLHRPVNDILSRVVHHTRRHFHQQCSSNDVNQIDMGLYEVPKSLPPAHFESSLIRHRIQNMDTKLVIFSKTENNFYFFLMLRSQSRALPFHSRIVGTGQLIQE